MKQQTRRGPKCGHLSIALREMSEGEQFFTDRQDKDVTARASYYGVKVKTERAYIVSFTDGERIEPILRVTILEACKDSGQKAGRTETVQA
jgi:hypothetical protein